MDKNLAKIRLRTRDRLNIFTDLYTLLAAGIPILEAIESMETDSKGAQKKVLHYIRKSINQGIELSKALEKMPKAFDAVSVNLIRSAEAGGTLEQTLKDLVASTKKEMAFSEQLRSTMIYPLFVGGLFLAIVILMLTFVIPRISQVFTSLTVKMPEITKILIKSSNLFIAHWIVIVTVSILLVTGIVLIVKYNKRFFVRLFLKLPLLHQLGTNIDLARFCRSFGLLMSAGVPIVESLSLSEKVVQKKEIIKVIKQMQVDVNAGKSITLAMRGQKSIIPTVMWRSVKTAEVSGTLDTTLQNLTEHFDDQVNESLKILSSLFEPILIVVVGIMVGILMVSIIAPIYNMISQINSINK